MKISVTVTATVDEYDAGKIQVESVSISVDPPLDVHEYELGQEYAVQAVTKAFGIVESLKSKRTRQQAYVKAVEEWRAKVLAKASQGQSQTNLRVVDD